MSKHTRILNALGDEAVFNNGANIVTFTVPST